MRLVILFLVLVFLIDILGFYIGSYRIPLYDTILHFFGGFFVAMFFSHYFKNLIPGNPGSPKLKKMFIIVSAAIFVGAMWEITEYISTEIFSNYLYETYRIVCCIGNLNDTISDLAMDITGAITYVLVFLFPSKINSRPK